MLRFGPPVGPTVLIAPALFEEANRTRAFTVTLQRALADLSLASMLPDLPGTNESVVDTEQATLANWQAAFAAAAQSAARHGHVHVAAIRGGALVDRLAKTRSRWYFAPVAGEALVRDLLRAGHVAQLGQPAHTAEGDTLELAGNRISASLIAELRAAAPTTERPVRTMRLFDDAMPSDRSVDGAPLWRRAEPSNDPTLAGLLAADLASWVRQCEK